jgi:cathepsin B
MKLLTALILPAMALAAPETFGYSPTSAKYYQEKYGSNLLAQHPVNKLTTSLKAVVNVTSPDEYDMRDAFSACSSPVKVFDQGSCGGCWALSTAGTISDRFCAAGVDVILSPQDVLDCVTGESKGCNGGFTEDGFDFANDEGIRTEACVPFTAEDGFCSSSCTGSSGEDDKKYYTKSFAQYVSSKEDDIKAELVAHGSVSAVFEVFSDFFGYTGGVYSHESGDYAGLHAVVLVGYGTSDEGVDYWSVRNSWGEDFGEEGHFRIKRGLSENGCNFEGGLTAGDVAA